MKISYTCIVTLFFAAGAMNIAKGQTLSLSQTLAKARAGHRSLLGGQSDVAAANARESMRNADRKSVV